MKFKKNVEVVLKETRDWLGAADFLTTVTSEQIWRETKISGEEEMK